MTDQLEIKRLFPFSKEITNRDAAVFHALFETNKFYKRKKLNFIFDSETYKKMIKSIKCSKMIVLYAVLNDEIIGFITFEETEEDEKEMQIFMTPNWRFKGYGLTCLLMAEKFMLRRYKRLKSLTCQPTNLHIINVLDKASWYECCEGFCGDYRKDFR
jgi:RimJ/RimL family protein N-acetyltransferase